MPSTKEETDVSKEVKTEETTELVKYELMLILVPDLSEDELAKKLKSLKKLITDMTGDIYHEDNWDIRDLAYMIKKQDKGYYIIFYFTLENTEGLKEFERGLLLDVKVLRHMLVKSPKGYQMKKLSELELSEEDLKKKSTPRPRKAKFAAKPSEKPKEEKKEDKPAKVEEKDAPKEEKAEVKEEKPEKVEEKEAPKEEKTESKEEKEDKKKSLDISDLDSKLESILDSDLDLKI